MRVAVLGGYGNFGARICRALAGEPSIELLVGGRDAERAVALVGQLGGHTQAIELDAASERLADALRAAAVELLIHTAGPFQGQDYRVARAAARAGAHYIDLADGRRFVCDFAAALGEAFHAAGRQAVSGASTVPALSSAVVDRYRGRFTRLDEIEIGIAPAHRTPGGHATLAAVLSYCGEPIDIWVDGAWQRRVGWADIRPVSFERLPARLGAWCEIPDLELFASRYPGVRSVSFRTALESSLAQRSLATLAWLRQRRRVPNLRPLAPWFGLVGKLFDRFGGETGGMVVTLRGASLAGRRSLVWHLSAEHNRGAEIPCLASIILARRWARGEQPVPGASPCLGLVALHEFEPEIERLGMIIDLVSDDHDSGP